MLGIRRRRQPSEFRAGRWKCIVGKSDGARFNTHDIHIYFDWFSEDVQWVLMLRVAIVKKDAEDG